MERRKLKPEVVEAASAAYYDAMIGQPPHSEGWAGKSEPFKQRVRVKMDLAIHAAIAKAKELDNAR